MTCVLLMFLLPVVEAQRAPACPVSCAVCSEDAVICQRLADIIDAANSTQALLLTEGSISVVQPASLSDLRNITVIGLSSNLISELSEDAFRNLPFLHTLLLDHNLLTSQALQGGALINLSQLEVLALGHNHIDMIQAGWFTGTKALLSLKLEGNLVTRLNPGSFPLNDFRSLETLDLSDNLIDFLDRNSFRGLVSLRSLDLSRNRLSSVPPEAFSYLVWLSNLNLDLNSWNCTCELLELAAVLTSFIQEPDKALYNGRRMMCVSADNPAVTTVLELTEANCVPSNQNITVQIEARGSVAPRQYARDLAIAAVICFLGGVALTLLAVLICYHVSQRKKKKKKKESQRPKEELDKGRTTANHVDQLGDRERMRDFVLQANSSQQWSKESMTVNERMDHQRDTFKSRAEENGSNVHCPHCNTNGKMPDQMRKGKWLNGGPEAGDVQERRKLRMMVEEERRRGVIQQQNYSWNVSNKVPPHIADSSFHLLRETSDNLPPYKADGDMGNHRTDDESKSRRYETSHCRNCHRTFRPEENMTHRMPHSNQMDIYDFNGKVRREPFRKMNTELKRETKNVKFDLTRSRTNRGEESLEEEEQEEATPRGNEKSSDRRHKVQSSRLMKVKLNLNPLRKSKVHPRKKNEHGHTKNTSSKRSKEKRRHGKGEEEEGEEKSGKRAKSSREKKRKSSKTEKADEGEQKSSTSKRDKSAEGDQEKNPNISQPPDGDTVSAQDLQTLQYQSAGLALGGAQLAFQHPFSFSPADRNRSTNLSLLNSPGSLLTGSTLSLQAGKALLNTMSSGSNPLLTHGLVNPIAPGVTLSGLNIAPGGATESFARLPAVLTRSSNPPLLAKAIQVNPLQAGGNPPAPFLTSTSDGPVLSLANPANDPVALGYSQIQVDSSAFVAAPKLDLTHSQDIQTGKGPIQSTTESQAPSTKDDVPEQDQDETLGDTSETRVEKMSVNMPPEGVAQTEGPHVGGSGERLKADSMSVMDQSAPSLSIPDESSLAAGGAALLQQEYLSEDGGSSPRRKLRLVLPEKTSNRPPTALERKIL
ncbi:leucine-rich repeat-containing protein 53 [Xiphophorus hellerii]|uniref:leucine-rich repeat-containing protein 53 n=1 Tax=Xiphophorus hellerii TaxID=8084 RepID=UPI0013B40751|nr:leucine-rich repeat-containing protein 53 [Xiphophorus hellerii]